MKRALATILVAATILVGFTLPAKAESAPAPAGHCQYGYALTYIECVSAGLRWISATESTQADRVRCEIPGNYRIVCFNYTPYAVRIRLNIFTTNGIYVRYFTMNYTRRTVFSPAYINRITWRWWWA